MKDQLITYETAILAKKAGFHIPVRYGVYGPKMKLTENHGWERRRQLELTDWNVVTKQQKNSQATSVPTQSLLKRWLRELYHIHILVFPQTAYNKVNGFISNDDEYHYTTTKLGITPYDSEDDDVEYTNFDSALEAALKKGLEFVN